MSKVIMSVLVLLLCFCLICSLCGVSFASAGDEVYTVGNDASVVIVLPAASEGVSEGALAVDDFSSIEPQVLSPVTASSTTGLKSVLLSILGDYEAIFAEFRYTSGSNYSYTREIQPDYVWLSSAAVFAILLYCTWRIVGGLICKR